MNAPPLLSCRGITKRFGALAAVNGVDFDVQPGEVLGIGGPNGAGKTTLFDVISGLTTADEGNIRLNDARIVGRTPWDVCHLGIARTFQLNSGFDTLTARENVEVAACFGHHNRLFPPLRLDAETRRRAEAALALVGVANQANTIVRDLPVLSRKLLMVAGAVATAPRMILLDEPVGGLNPEEIECLGGILRRIRDTGVTLILIEHVMSFLVTLADRIMILHHGEKIYDGTANGLVQDKSVVEIYLGEAMALQLHKQLAAGADDGCFAACR